MSGAGVAVALLSDTHGFIDPRILAEALACERIVHAGDVGGLAVLQALSRGPAPLLAVRGNNDIAGKWPPAERARLATLPLVARLDLPGGVLVVAHGHQVSPASRRHDRLRRAHPEARAVIYGHSHRVAIDQTSDPWVLNPGAAGRSRTFGGPSYIRLVARPELWTLELRRFSPAVSRRGGGELKPRPGRAAPPNPRSQRG